MQDDTPENPESVLAPEELRLDEEHAATIGENRYLVATDEETTPTPRGPEPADEEAVRSTQYSVALTVRSEHGVHSDQVDTDDVREAFDETLLAFCDAVAPETPPERALAVLLARSELTADDR